MISFVATAVIVVLILIHYYLFAHDPTRDPFDRIDETRTVDYKPNPVDEVFLRHTRKRSSETMARHARLRGRKRPMDFEKVCFRIK
jgi:hypothetical protein